MKCNICAVQMALGVRGVAQVGLF